MKRRIPVLMLVMAVLAVAFAIGTGLFSGLRGQAPYDETEAGPEGLQVGVAARIAVALDREQQASRRVLADWDARRAAAWAAGDVDRLRDLYTADSEAGAVDVARLEQWHERGLRVEGMETQVLEFTVISATSDRIVLDVTDRLAGGFAVGSGHRIELPSDQPDRHRITLVRESGQWLVS